MSTLFDKLPLRVALTMPFVILILAIGTLIGYLTFQNSQSAVNQLVGQLHTQATARIRERLDSYLATPQLINQLNLDSTRLEQVQLQDLDRMGQHFITQIQRFDSVVSIAYANEQAEYAGATQKIRDGLTLSFSDQHTNHVLTTYYSDAQGKPLEQIDPAIPAYDPRPRPWYRAAVEAGESIWTPIYVWSSGRVGLDAVTPVLDREGKLIGVLDTSLILTGISDFLQSLQVTEHEQTFIIERSGLLVAASAIKEPYTRVGDELKRLSALESTEPVVRIAAHQLAQQFGGLANITTSQSFHFDLADERHFAHVTPYQDRYGLDWLIVVVVPESDFMTQIYSNNRNTALVVLVSLLVSIGIATLMARRVTQPILRLNQSASLLAQGDWTQVVVTDRSDEVGQLARAFNHMAEQLQTSFASVQASEERYARLADATFEGIAFHEHDILFDTNARLAEIFGYTIEELIGMPTEQLVAPESRNLVRRRMQTGYQGLYEHLALRKDGSIFPVEVRSRSFQVQGRALRVTVVRDISERVAAQHALAQSELRFRSAFHANPTPQILTHATNGTFLDVNAAYEQLTCYTCEELLGKRTSDFPIWVDLDRATLMAKMAATRRLHDWPTQVRDKAGVLHDLILSIEPLQVGEVSCLLSVMIDITARKRAEEELRLLQTTALAISVTKDLPTALAVALQQVCEATGWVLGQAWVPHPGAAVLECSAAWSGGAPELEPFQCASTGTTLPPGVGLPGRVWQAQRAIWIQDVTDDTNFPRASFAQEVGLKAAIAFPVLAGADVVAVLEFFVREPRPEDDHLIKLISTVAAQLGTVIQRKQAEDALRASEERYRRIVETAEEGIWVLDRANITTFVNPKLARWLGYSEDEMIGQSVFGFLAEEQQAHVAQRLEQRRHGISEQHEVRLCRKDGTPLWAIVSANPIQDQQGGYAGALAMLTDITARKQAEALRIGQNQLLEMIATNAPLQDVLVTLTRLVESHAEGLLCSILLLDDDGEHVRHAAAPSLPAAYINAIDGSSIGPRAGSCGTAMERREPIIVTDIFQDPLWSDYCGLVAPYGLRACCSTPIVSHQGQVFGSFAMYYREVRSPSSAEMRLNEIAIRIAGIAIERTRIEDELRKHREHLEERIAARTSELAIAKNKAEEADRLKSAFLATMSHELRTPLNSIIGFTGIMLQGLVGALNDEQQKQLAMVKNSARHLLNLINEVLDLSKIEAGQVELHLEPFVMRTLIDKTVKTLAPQIAKKQLALIVDIAPEIDQVISDRRRVEQILLNLVNNAVKFTERGEVRIECRIRGRWLLTSVVDSGIGIKPEDMPKLFTTFLQLDSRLSRKHEGTGLGLAICKKLVELLGGEIQAESVWERGSIFTFTLPQDRQQGSER